MTMKIRSDFVTYLLENTKLKDSAVACCGSGSSNETWFKDLFAVISPKSMYLINLACRRVVAIILTLFRETCCYGSRSRHAGMWYQVYRSIDSGMMFGEKGPFKDLPPHLKKSRSGLYILVESIAKLVVGWLHDEKNTTLCQQITDSKQDENHVESREDRNRKIFGFVGYALSSTIKRYNEKEERAEMLDEHAKLETYRDFGTFLRTMRLLHKDALLDTYYMEHCYSSTNKMLNRGGMALISPAYFKFAEELTMACDSFISDEMIVRRGNNTLREANDSILSDACLKKKWDESHDETSKMLLGTDHRDEIYREIVHKTINSRFSFEVSKVRATKFGHYAKSASTETHRADLKHDFAKNKMKVDGETVRREISIRMTTGAADVVQNLNKDLK